MKLTKRKTSVVAAGHEPAFREIISLITAARYRAFQAVNTELIGLYWRIGQYISRKLESAAWGEGVVDELARYIASQQPDIKGFTRRNLFRMRQFYETYRRQTKVSPLVTQLPWTHNLLILSGSPALIAEYQTALPDRKLLQRKLHEFYQLAMPKEDKPKAALNARRAKKT